MYLDKPITDTENDFLNRNDFAIKLAKSISNWRNKESWVIALTGDWGSGKTSIKNLMVKELKKAGNPIHIIEFSPWEWASQESINQAFFNEISIKLGKEKANTQLQSLSKKWNKLGYYFNNINAFSEPTVKLLPVIIGSIIIILNSFAFKSISNQSIELLVEMVVAVFGLWFILAKGMGDYIKSRNERINYLINENKQSVSELKTDIAKDLEQIDNPILIVLDDLDRLTPSQLMTITQLVKANSDFLNIIFLLLYSKSIVEEKLTDKNQNDTAYMEKIVQVEFAVPKVDESLILNYFDEKIVQIVNGLNVKNKSNIYDNGYLSYVFNQGELSNYFKDLRNLYRFLNSFEFNLHSFVRNDFLEVNFTDLFAIEVIRLFEPKLYQGIIENKDFLIKGYEIPNNTRNRANNREEYLSKANEFLVKYEGFKAKECLKLLFPIFDNYFHNLEGYFGGRLDTIELRICSEQSFDNYFIQSVPQHILSQSELIDYIDSLNNITLAKTKLLHIYNTKKFTSFQKKLPSHFDMIDNKNLTNLFISLKNLAEFANDEGFISDSNKLYFLTLELFKKLSQEKIFEISKDISETNVKEFKFLINLHHHFNRENNHYNLTNQDYLTFKSNLQKLIEDAILNNFDTFADRDNKISILKIWHDLDEQNSKTFIQNKFKNFDKFFKTLSLFISTSTINSSASYKPYKRTTLSKENLYLFIDKSDFENILSHHSQRQDLSDTEKELIEMYNNPREW